MRPVTVTAGALAAAAATAIALAQTSAGAGELAINGTLATAGWIGTAAIAGTVLTVSGTTQGAIMGGGVSFPSLSGLGVAAGTVILGPGPGVSAAGGGTTWTVAPAQTVASRTLYTNAVAKIAVPAQVTVTSSSGTDTGLTITLTGTDWSGSAISETLGVAAGAVATSVLTYASITQAVISGSTTGTVSIGIAQQGSSPWVRLDDFAPGPTSLTMSVSGSVTYTVQQSNQDPNDPTNPATPASMTWVNSSDATVVGASTSVQSFFTNAPRWVRVITTAGSGSVSMTIAQQGAVPY